MAAGDMGKSVLRATSGIIAGIDPKNTLKYVDKATAKTSRAYKVGKNTTNFLAGGIRDTIGNMSKVEAGGKGMKFGEALATAHKSVVKDAKGKAIINKTTGKAEMKYNAGKIAGTFAGVSMAGRVVTGGGLYRDKNGNVNLPGIPFI